MVKSVTYKSDMVIEAETIIASVEWLRTQMEKKIKEIDKLETILDPTEEDSKNLDSALRQLATLYARLQIEDKNMSDFMTKYRTIIEHAKKELLFNPGKEEQVCVRGVSKNATGKKRS